MNDNTSSTTQTETLRLAAIMFTDIVGFSRQMGSDEARMLRLLEVHNQLVSQVVTVHHGHVIKTIGDAFLVDFPSVVHAVHVPNKFTPSYERTTLRKTKPNRFTSALVFIQGTSCRKTGMCSAMG